MYESVFLPPGYLIFYLGRNSATKSCVFMSAISLISTFINVASDMIVCVGRGMNSFSENKLTIVGLELAAAFLTFFCKFKICYNFT